MSHPPSDPSDDEDKALMVKIANGNESAFRDLIEKHQAPIFATLLRMMNNRHDAEDLAQQTFLRLWKSASRYKPKAKFTTYLFTIAKNLAYNETRNRSNKTHTLSTFQQENSSIDSTGTHHSSPDDELIHRELEYAVERALANLPDKQRLAVILRRYQELPYEEIAAILKVSLPALKSLLFRARDQLRKDLSKHLQP